MRYDAAMTRRPHPGCARAAALLGALLALAVPAAAQDPGPGLPRVIYGAPSPQVLYGAPSTPDPPPAPRRPAPPAAIPPQAPQGSLTYESGPAYLPPPAYWGVPPGGWGAQPGWDGRPRPARPAPPNPPRTISPEGGRFERPLPQGRYVGRPPGAPPEPPIRDRPRGF
jgi:hypothetical protein